MRINDFEKMQQNLNKMKSNLENLNDADSRNYYSTQPRSGKRQAVHKKTNFIKRIDLREIAREEKMIFMATVVIIIITIFFSTSIFAKTISSNMVERQSIARMEDNEEEPTEVGTTESVGDIENENIEIDEIGEQEEIEEEIEQSSDTVEIGDLVVESNDNQIKLEEILLENVSVLKSKEYAEEVREVEYETEYNDNPNLPEGIEVVTEQGTNGSEQVTVIKSYENNELVSENVIDATPIEEAISEKIDVGTSKFLGDNKVYLGDTMYVTEEVSLKSRADDSSEEICTILDSLDVTLEELEKQEKWCKVEYDGLEGYVQSKYLTSSDVTPEIVEANRIQKIKMTLSEDIPLNESTSLTYDDYKRILSGISLDKNNVIEDNAEVFYNMDKEYNMNGVFLASIAIHESGWATSTISKDKKNLFGYGAYDSSPYQSSYSFETYAEGIETVAKALVKYYINEEGTPIYDDEIARGSYYNGPTVADVNMRYASDTEWHNKVYSYMEYLYNRL